MRDDLLSFAPTSFISYSEISGRAKARLLTIFLRDAGGEKR